MGEFSVFVAIGLGVLMIDSLVEMGFIASTVRFLNTGADGPYTVNYKGSTFQLASKPANLEVNQGHTANGAAGTALILVGLCGLIALFLRNRPGYAASRVSVFWYRAWLVLTVPAVLLSLAALIYVSIVTAAADRQTIDVALAAGLAGGAKYPALTWTPQSWYAAVLNLPLADAAQVSTISTQWKVMQGWRINIRPLFVIQIAVTGLAWADMWGRRSWSAVASTEKREGFGSMA